MISKRILVLIFCIQFLGTFAFAQKKFFITNYTTKNGLPDNNLQTIQMDKDGFLWASYSNGLLRFDGYNFRKFITSSIPYTTLLINRTLAGELLAWDVSGTVFEINNQHIDTLRKGAINSINYYIAKGTLPGKKYYFESTSPHFNDKRDKRWFYPPMNLFPQSTEDCIIRTEKGLGWYHFTEFKKELNLENYKPRHFISINKEIYFFSEKNQLYRADTKTWTVQLCELSGDLLKNSLFFTHPELFTNTTWDYNSSASCILIDNSLYELRAQKENPGQISSILVTNELPKNCIINSLIYQPQTNLLLIATDTRGLFVYREQKFKFLTYPNPERGTNNAYYCQVEMDSNRLYTDWNREFTIDGGQKSKMNIKKNYSDNIFRDKDGYLWYMIGEETLKKFDPKTNTSKTIYNTNKEFALCYYQEGDSIWVGTTNSISYIKNDTLRTAHVLDNNSSNSNLFQVMRWKDNKIWFCNYTGVFKYDPVSHKIDTLQKLFQTYPYNFNIHNDYLIIGTFGRGFFFYKDGKTVRMPQDANHFLQQAYLFINDSAGYTWIATSNGMYKTRFSDLEKYFNDTTYKVTYLHYGEEDGILSPEFNGGCVPPYLTLKNGYISIPNVEGLVWFKPNEFRNPDYSRSFFIDGIYVDGSLIPSENPVHVSSNARTLRIDFSTPYWGTADNLFLEYNLEGYTKQWLPLTVSQNSIEFSNLPSGTYTFQLRKRGGFDPDNYITSTLEIIVGKKFYETAWFIILCVLAALLFTFAVARLYAYNIQKRNRVLEQNVQQRTIELSKANEALQQSVSVKDKLISIISHDIVTPLRFITMVAQKGSDKNSTIEKENIQSAMADIKNTSQKLHDNAQNILNWIKHQNKRITVNKTNVAVAALADDISEQLMEMSASRGTRIVNTISEEDIIKTDATILSVILHNLVSNATKFTNNGSIELSAVLKENIYQISITDTGSGMNEEQLNRIKRILRKEAVSTTHPASGENGNGLGYIIIIELLELLNGSLRVESALGKGTKVQVLVKL